MSSGLVDIAFGPDESFVVVPKGDDFPAFWSGFINDKFQALVNSGKTMQCFAYTRDDNWFVAFEDGGLQSRLHKDFAALLKKVHGAKWISLGPDDSYIFKGADGTHRWWNIPNNLQKEIQKRKAQLTWATLGQDSSYVAGFDDGTYIWQGVPWHLDSVLRTGKVSKKTKITSVDRVWLSAIDDRFYLEYNGGSAHWCSCGDYFDAMMSCDALLRPEHVFFTQESISSKFRDGTSIYETAWHLNDGRLGITELPYVEVFYVPGNTGYYMCKNNRRLWCYRNSGVHHMPVKIVAAPPNASKLYKRSEVYVRYWEA